MLSFQLGKTRCHLWFSFFAVICLFCALGKSQWGLWCVLMSLLHECGHYGAFVHFGAAPKELHLEYSGIRLVPNAQPLSISQEWLVLFAGSAVNLLLAGLLFLFHLPLHAGFPLVLGLFNLLPLAGLDGGQMLLLLLRRLSPLHGDRIAEAISLFTQLVLSLAAIWLFIKTGNFTLLLVLIYFFLLTIPKER